MKAEEKRKFMHDLKLRSDYGHCLKILKDIERITKDTDKISLKLIFDNMSAESLLKLIEYYDKM